jgi:predicted dehydrogenase
MGKQGTIGVAFVGVGAFIAGNHLPNLAEHPRFRIRWLCDLNEKTLKDRVRRFQPDRHTTRIEDILEDSQVDLVIIGTRQDARPPLIRQCADARKHVFVEKPMSSSTTKSRKIVRWVRESGILFQVGYNRRYAPALVEARRRFHQLRARAKYPPLVTYRAVDESFLWPSYPFDPATGGKVFHEACHFLDMACWFMGKLPVSIVATGQVRDNQISTLEFEDGASFSFVNGGDGCASYPKERLEAWTAWSTIVMENFIELTVATQKDWRVTRYPLFRDRGRRTRRILTPEAFNRLTARWRQSISDAEFQERHYYRSYPTVDKGHLAQFLDLADAIREKRPTTGCNEMDGARATYLCERCIEAIHTGRRVRLKREFL